MPNIKSAKKRVKVIMVKSLRNKMCKSSLKTAINKANFAIDNDLDNKNEAIRFALKKIDQATSKGIFHKNAAARKKSALVKRATLIA